MSSMFSKWPLTPLDTDFAEGILPADTWTEIILLSQTPINGDVYACTTEENIKAKEKYMNILSSVSQHFEKNEEYKFNELVAVKVDEKWCRGRLICFNAFMPNDNTLIQLVDEGSFCIVNFKNIFKLHFFERLDPLALFITFKNFIPKTRKLIVKPLFLELNSLSAGFVFVDVKLEDSDNKQTKEKIVEKGVIPHKSEKDLPFSNGDNCRLLYVEDFMSVYICPAENNYVTNYYKQCDYDFHKKIEISKDFTPKSSPNAGVLVKVVSPHFNKPYRAEILNKTKDNKYDVFYIDYGNVENVPSNVIYELDEALKNKPRIAVKVGMSDLKHITITEEVNDILEEFYDKLLVIEFDEESKNLENVKLKDPSVFGKYFNAMLSIKKTDCMNVTQVNKNTALNNDIEIKQLSSLKNKDPVNNLKHFEEPVFNGILSQDDQNNEIVKVKGNIMDDFQSVNLENGDYCILSYFESFESIFLCKAVKDSANYYVTHNFDVIVKTMKSEDREIKNQLSAGDFVKVFSPYHKDMYRATITDIVDAKYHVYYVDFGSKEIVNSSDIFKLSDDLKIKIPLPLQVSLDLPSIVKKTVLIESLFEDLTENGVVLSINFTTKNSTDIASVTLTEVVSGKSVNEEVLKLLSTKIKMPLKNFDVCNLAHFENFNNMFVFKKEELQITYDTANSVDLIIKTNLAVGDIVKVFSPIFDGLFRAKIMNHVNEEQVEVFHIDFGSTEVISVKNVYELSEELKIKPGIAVKVQVKVPNNVKINEEIIEFFSTLCKTMEPLSIEFDDSCEKGLENCTLKVISIGLNVIDIVLQVSKQPPVYQR